MSDLKITHSGIEQTQTSQGPILSGAALGQQGAMFLDAVGAIEPPTNRVFVAIQLLEDCTFNSTDGLVAETTNRCFNTNSAAHNAITATASQGKGGKQVDVNNVFPAGMTLYGRWTKLTLAGGACIAYFG